MEDRNAVTKIHHQRHLMLDQEQCETAPLKRPQPLGQGAALLQAEASRRLVEEEETGAGRQSTAELGEPLEPVRQL